MTYNMLMGSLNPTHLLAHLCILCVTAAASAVDWILSKSLLVCPWHWLCDLLWTSACSEIVQARNDDNDEVIVWLSAIG